MYLFSSKCSEIHPRCNIFVECASKPHTSTSSRIDLKLLLVHLPSIRFTEIPGGSGRRLLAAPPQSRIDNITRRCSTHPRCLVSTSTGLLEAFTLAHLLSRLNINNIKIMAPNTYTWTSAWFLLSTPIVLWDAFYCLMR
jgi:hypothetical protein